MSSLPIAMDLVDNKRGLTKKGLSLYLSEVCIFDGQCR